MNLIAVLICIQTLDSLSKSFRIRNFANLISSLNLQCEREISYFAVHSKQIFNFIQIPTNAQQVWLISCWSKELTFLNLYLNGSYICIDNRKTRNFKYSRKMMQVSELSSLRLSVIKYEGFLLTLKLLYQNFYHTFSITLYSAFHGIR